MLCIVMDVDFYNLPIIHFRAKRPLFSPEPFSVRGWPAADGHRVRLVAVNPEGSAAMVAEAVLAP